MIYVAFPHNTYISEVHAPEDKTALWLLTNPTGTYQLQNNTKDVLTSPDIRFSVNVTNPEIYTVYTFNELPIVKCYDNALQYWKTVDSETVSSWILPYVNSDDELVIRQAYQTSVADGTLKIQ